MDAAKQQIASIFNGHTVFVVPFYQRSYVWKEEQWNRFLEDMEFVSSSAQDYFLGSVIVKQQPSALGDFDHRTIIDGQQRFTTLAIFLKVLCLKTDDLETFNHHFTVRNKKLKTKAFAIKHSLNDRNDFERVLNLSENIELEDENPSNIVRAYNFFRENIDVEKVDVDQLLSHIVFVGIDLQQNDDEQVIFDTINSLGVRLTTGELLKNYFFNEGSQEEYEELWMPVFESDKLTSDYWNSQVTAGRIKRSNIDAFFGAFLNIKIQDKRIGVDTEHKIRYRRADGIFANYKDFISTYNLNKRDFIWEIVDYAEVFKNNFDSNIAKSELPGYPCIERINFIVDVLDCSTLIPYVLFVLKNVPNEDERNAIFGYIESYVMRRFICKSDNKNFSDLFSENLIGNNICTLEALRDYIENRGDNQALAIPNDDYVRECINLIKQPNKRALAILFLIETRLREGKPHATKLYAFDGYSLEHLMPKKWEKNWPLNKGYDAEDRNNKIETLGNMAMLPSKLNSSISNANWTDKKNGKNKYCGLKKYASGLMTLQNVIKLKEWNEDAIEDRSEWLSNIVVQIWPSYLPGCEIDTTFDLTWNGETESYDDSIAGSPEKKKRDNSTHDNTKYSLNGSDFLSKSEFVSTFVRAYIEKYPDSTYEQLKRKFHDGLCAPGFKFIGLLCTEDEYNSWDNKNKAKRYQPDKPLRRMRSSDDIVFFVNTQWTQDSMKQFVKLAKAEGWTIVTMNKQ